MDTIERTGLLPIETSRLVLAELTENDLAFIRALVNDKGWLRYIGDKNVHSDDDALRYLRTGPQAMYARHGLGLWRVSLKDLGTPVGICGLIKRDGLDDLDLGFAFLPEYRAKGYAEEASRAVLDWGLHHKQVRTVVAIATFDNQASDALLKRLGFTRDGEVKLPNADEALYKYRLELSDRISLAGRPT